jgi:exportin-T
MTLFFLCTYLEQWPTFFTDFFTLVRPQTQSASQDTFNPHVSLLLFHLILEISGEVADQTLKSARAFNITRHARDGKVRDAVRERDAPAINDAVLTIVADSATKLSETRAAGTEALLEKLEEVVDWGIRAFGSYVGQLGLSVVHDYTS